MPVIDHKLKNPSQISHWIIPYDQFLTREDWYRWVDNTFDSAEKAYPEEQIYAIVKFCKGTPSRVQTFRDKDSKLE